MKNLNLHPVHRYACHTSYRTTSLAEVTSIHSLMIVDSNKVPGGIRQAVAVSRWK